MVFNFQWCKRHRKPSPLSTVIFCPGCALESTHLELQYREALEQIMSEPRDGRSAEALVEWMRSRANRAINPITKEASCPDQ